MVRRYTHGLGSLRPSALCPPGQVEDYDPATGQYLGTCVDDTPGYRAGPLYTPPVSPGSCRSPMVLLDVGGDAPICVTRAEAEAIAASGGKQTADYSQWILWGGIGLVVVMLLGGKKR